MMEFILLGGLLGLGVSAAIREFSVREIIGFSILGIGGSVYGTFLASLALPYLQSPSPIMTPLLTLSMALLFMGIKIALLKRQKDISTRS